MALGPDPLAFASSPTVTQDLVGPRAVAPLKRWALWRNLASFRRRDKAAAESERAAIDGFNRGVMLAATGDVDAALCAYHHALASATGHLAAKTVFNMAVLLGEDHAQAAAAYRIAIETGHEDVAPRAAYNLGSLLQQHGDLAGAEQALARALEFDHEEVTRDAALKLAQLRGAARAATLSASAGRLIRARRGRRRGYQTVWLAGPNRFSRIRRARGHAC